MCPYCQHDLTHDIDTDLDTCPACGFRFPVERPVARIACDWQWYRDELTSIAQQLPGLLDTLKPESRQLLQQVYQWATEGAEEADNQLRGNDVKD